MPRLTGETSAAPATETDVNIVTLTTSAGTTIVEEGAIKTLALDPNGDNLSHLVDELLYELRLIRQAAESSLAQLTDSVD